MNSLSKREKSLLYFLLCFLIVMGGVFFLLLPSISRYQTAKEELSAKELERQQMEASIQNIQANQDNLAKLQEKLQTERGRFYPVMTNQDIDRVVTGMVSKYLPVSSELEITSPARKQIPAYVKGQSQNGGGAPAQQQTGEEDTTTKTWVSQVKLRSTGSLAGFMDLLGEIGQTPSVRVLKMEHTFDQQSKSDSFEITFEILMIEASS